MFHTSIHFDTEIGELIRRDVALDVWEEELKERTPIAYWRTVYAKPDLGKAKPEISTKESAEGLLRRLIDDDHEHTEHARYILTLMLERKKQLVPKQTKHTEQGILLLYEHRKSGEVFIIRDPELRLDEIESVQEEVATLLGFGGPVVEAAKVAGVTLTPDGKVMPKGDDPAAPAEEPVAEVEVPTTGDAVENSDAAPSEPSQEAEEAEPSSVLDTETPDEEATSTSPDPVEAEKQ